MKKAVLLILLIITICSCDLAAQRRSQVKTDSVWLSCILLNAKNAPPEKQAYVMDTKELKLAQVSETDTTVKACIDGVVSKVQRDEDGKFEIVFYHNDYWFWLSGVTKAVVKPNQKIKRGDVLGINQTGEKIELLMYDFETPVDPKTYLNCKE